MEKFYITDKRKLLYFKLKTFNNYKKTDIFNKLKNSILEKNLEKSILWLTELHCSCCTKRLYNYLLKLYILYINRENLYILEIFIKKYKFFNSLKNNLNDRNNIEIRKYLYIIVFYLTISSKKNLSKLPKLKKSDYNLNLQRANILTKNLKIIKKYTKKEDNKNIFIAISEIYYNLLNKNKSKSLENCLFWLSWILNYEKNYHNGNIKCALRKINNLNKKYWTDFVWIIWEIILNINNTKYILYLFNLFKLNYNITKKNQKINYIVFAFSIIINLYPKINFNFKLNNIDSKLKLKMLKNMNYQYFLLNKNYKPVQNLNERDNSNRIKKIKSNKKIKTNIKNDETKEIDQQIINHNIAINTIIPYKKRKGDKIIIKNNKNSIYKKVNIIKNIQNKDNIIKKIVKLE